MSKLDLLGNDIPTKILNTWAIFASHTSAIFYGFSIKLFSLVFETESEIQIYYIITHLFLEL